MQSGYFLLCTETEPDDYFEKRCRKALSNILFKDLFKDFSANKKYLLSSTDVSEKKSYDYLAPKILNWDAIWE